MPAPLAEQPGPVAGDTELQSVQLEELTQAVNYRDWLVSLALPHLGDHALEVGSGTGDYASDFADRGVKLTASEADPARLAQLHSRFAADDRVAVRSLVLPTDEQSDFSGVVAFNVLEHIPDDVGALRSFRELVRPGGSVVVFVPAFMFAFSRHDERIGHQRRYRKREVVAACRAAGLQVEQARYVNPLGLLAWFVGMRLLKGQPRWGPALWAWDRGVIPLTRRLEKHVRPPFGQSVFVVARRPVAVA